MAQLSKLLTNPDTRESNGFPSLGITLLGARGNGSPDVTIHENSAGPSSLSPRHPLEVEFTHDSGTISLAEKPRSLGTFSSDCEKGFERKRWLTGIGPGPEVAHR